jgi:hypothetical protein
MLCVVRHVLLDEHILCLILHYFAKPQNKGFAIVVGIQLGTSSP